jgi:hypothetical protein
MCYLNLGYPKTRTILRVHVHSKKYTTKIKY